MKKDEKELLEVIVICIGVLFACICIYFCILMCDFERLNTKLQPEGTVYIYRTKVDTIYLFSLDRKKFVQYLDSIIDATEEMKEITE